jgi:hypothetical protein
MLPLPPGSAKHIESSTASPRPRSFSITSSIDDQIQKFAQVRLTEQRRFYFASTHSCYCYSAWSGVNSSHSFLHRWRDLFYRYTPRVLSHCSASFRYPRFAGICDPNSRRVWQNNVHLAACTSHTVMVTHSRNGRPSSPREPLSDSFVRKSKRPHPSGNGDHDPPK